MSYILDALRKAGEERDRPAPVLKRLLGPAPPPRSGWARSPGRLLTALLLNTGLLIVLLVIWLRPVPIAAPPEAVGVPGVATAPSQQSSALEPPATMPRTPERRAAAPRTAPGPPPPKPAKAVAPTPPPPAAAPAAPQRPAPRSEEHTSELQSQSNLVCRLLLEKKKHNLIDGTLIREHHRQLR